MGNATFCHFFSQQGVAGVLLFLCGVFGFGMNGHFPVLFLVLFSGLVYVVFFQIPSLKYERDIYFTVAEFVWIGCTFGLGFAVGRVWSVFFPSGFGPADSVMVFLSHGALALAVSFCFLPIYRQGFGGHVGGAHGPQPV